VREQRHGDAAYFVWNTHVNHTNVCVATCDFCAFAAKQDEPRAYTMSLDSIFDTVAKLPGPVREVHIVGGLHPGPAVRVLHRHDEGHQAGPARHPHQGVHGGRDLLLPSPLPHERGQVLAELKQAGLDSMPGGGAEIFAKETRDKIIKGKADAAQWLQVMREAHGQGIPTNATMLYGHIESVRDRVDHLVRLRELQDETGGFVTYIPLAFQPWEAPALRCPETTGFDDLKAIAVGRLMLDNFPHIKSYWIMIGRGLAQVGLSFGADDLDGTVTERRSRTTPARARRSR
jgi:aminodeoxyfutalosine synthase